MPSAFRFLRLRGVLHSWLRFDIAGELVAVNATEPARIRRRSLRGSWCREILPLVALALSLLIRDVRGGAAAGGGEDTGRQRLHDQACLHAETGYVHLSSVLADRGGHGIRDLRRRHLTHDWMWLEAGGGPHTRLADIYRADD